jgi:MFS family permease
MHTATTVSTPQKPALEGVKPYHILVLIIAAAGWLFDCMDQRLFVLARQPALKELLHSDPTALANINTYGGKATTWMILGWATGGIIFGMLSDKIGRVKTMIATLVIYSGFTGLSGLATGWNDFIVYRFLVGLGIGGMFGAATTLVAESVPSNFRATALGLLQALSAVGNVIGSLISLKIVPGAQNFYGSYNGWRLLFFVGILPAILTLPIMFFLKEPESWKQAKAAASGGQAKTVGSPLQLFENPRWRRNTIIGLMLGLAGMTGLWGVGFFSPELVSTALKDGNAAPKTIEFVKSWGTLLQDVGAFLGMLVFTYVAARVTRRVAFLCAFILGMGMTIFVFQSLHKASDAYWMLPMMGFAQLGAFAGYSIYFPELFPTRLRGTGVGFCYNTVRYLAAPMPLLMGLLSDSLKASMGESQAFRNAATIMCSVYLLGMIALIWAPETKGQPLPED